MNQPDHPNARIPQQIHQSHHSHDSESTQSSQTDSVTAMGAHNCVNQTPKEPPLKKFRSLYSFITGDTLMNEMSLSNTVEIDIVKYEEVVKDGILEDNGVDFWIAKRKDNKLTTISSFAIDLCSAPASEAFCKRIFSLCGNLSMGKRNRASTLLEKKVFLKLNNKHLQ